MSDEFALLNSGLTGPAKNAAAITPNDSEDLATATRGIYVGVSGDVKVDMVGTGTAVVFTGLAAGVIHPIRATRIYDTDTDATNIVGVW